MAAKEISVKKYVVRLSGEERERLEALIRKGKSPAQRLLKARILLKADVSEAGAGWSDSRIIKALDNHLGQVHHEQGHQRALQRAPQVMPKPQPPKDTGQRPDSDALSLRPIVEHGKYRA